MKSLRFRLLAIFFSVELGVSGLSATGQQGVAATPTTTSRDAASPASSTTAHQTQLTRAQRRAQRRARRLVNQNQIAITVQAPPALSPTAAQRVRDQKLLDQQKAQSAETAHENDITTRKVIQDQQQVQSETRIQDAPGPGSQPLPGDAAVQPAQPADPPRIQDAPGPSQTLPKPPPAAPTPAPQI